MKKTIYTASILTGLCLVLVMSCTKDIKDTTPLLDGLNTLARVQVYNSTLNTQRNFVFVDGSAVNGQPIVYTQTNATNIAHNGSGFVFALRPGTRAFIIRDTLASSTQPPLNFSYDFQADKSYTIFTYDSTNIIKQKLVPNEIVVPTDGTARLRFANFVFLKNSVPPPVDIFSRNKNANIFSNVAYTDVTNYISHEAGKADLFIVRNAGTLDALDTLSLNPTKERSYTLVFRGRYTTNEINGALYPRTLGQFVNY